MLKKLFFTNFISMIIMILLGVSLSDSHTQPLLNNLLSDKVSGEPLSEFKIIYHNNLSLLMYVFLGSITGGIFSFFLLCWNSFHLGNGIITLFYLNSSNHYILYSYIILEFISLGLAVTAAENFGINMFKYIFTDRIPNDMLNTGTLTIASFFLITLAGIIEAFYIHIS